MNRTLIAASALVAVLPAHADISVTASTFSYSQDFDTLTTSTTASAWVNDGTLPGWSLLVSTGAAATTIAADTGSSNAGTFRSFGSAGATERALGVVASGGAYFGAPASGAVADYTVVALRNDSGSTLDNFTLAYDGEQWRNGGNTNTQSLVLQYGFGASYATVASWSVPGGSFDFVSPVVGATAAAVDGNVAGKVAGLGGTISGATWLAGESLFIRWVDLNDVGNDHGLGIDNVTVSTTAVPEPGALAMLLAGLGFVGFVARRR